nr:MAG TPA: hypothetical protein [Caudoviricetes sp.]
MIRFLSMFYCYFVTNLLPIDLFYSHFFNSNSIF